MLAECPNHQGRFDCTPFCNLCEGEQEYQPGLLQIFEMVIKDNTHYDVKGSGLPTVKFNTLDEAVQYAYTNSKHFVVYTSSWWEETYGAGK